MSYCRFALDSNVYVYATLNGDGGIVCIIEDQIAKKFDVEQSFHARKTLEPGVCEKQMLGHLTYLQAHGIMVPNRATYRLIKEICESEGSIWEDE